MRKNVILSSVAATVVTGVLMMSGCNSSNNGKSVDQDYLEKGTVNVSVVDDEAGNLTNVKVTTGGKLQSTASIKQVKCVDKSGKAASCKTVCTPTNNCAVKIAAACSEKLNYSNASDVSGAWNLYNNSAAADVVAERADDTTVTTFSGVANITQTGGINSCNFDFSTFIVCAITKDGKKYYNASYNSEGYVLALIEYKDGTKEWKKVPITRKSNGTENDQPFIDMKGLTGEVPAKITIFSVLKKGASATGATGSTGAIS